MSAFKELITERLILRSYMESDLDDLFVLLSDREVNLFLPWFPVETQDAAHRMLYDRFLVYSSPDTARCYAVCLKKDNRPIGYITVGGDDSHDFGYALRREFWNNGIITEAAQAVINELTQAGLPYLTATHDVRNPASGAVMRKLGMTYRYSYEELWQPKNIPVIFRMYQIQLNGLTDQTYLKYWNQYPRHFIESFE